MALNIFSNIATQWKELTSSGFDEDTLEKISGIVSSGDVIGEFRTGLRKIPVTEQAVIVCPKKHIYLATPLTEDISTSVQSQWDDYFTNSSGTLSGLTNSLFDTVQSTTVNQKGISLRQPWMTRKTWKNSTPPSFTIPFTFVAFNDPETEVYARTMAAMALAYPMMMNSDTVKNALNTNELATFTSGLKPAVKSATENDPTEGFIRGAGTSMQQSKDDTVQALGNLFIDLSDIGEGVVDLAESFLTNGYRVPGPAPMAAKNEKTGVLEDYGTPVYLRVGNMIYLHSCYVTNVSVTWSKEMMNGYPKAATVSITVTAQYSNFVKENGSYSLREDKSMTQAINKQAEIMAKITNSTTNILVGGLNYTLGGFNLLTSKLGG